MPARVVSLCSLLLVTALSGCREAPVEGEPPDVPPQSIDGEPCTEAPGFAVLENLEFACNACECTAEGSWDCYPSLCWWGSVVEPHAELLVVVDDSSSMGPDRQARLARGMSSLLSELDAHPDPVHLRVAITTTDMSNPVCDPATADGGVPIVRSCLEHPEDFAAGPLIPEEAIPPDAADRGCAAVCEIPELRTIPTDATDDPTPRPRPWLERRGDATNLAGDVPFGDALACALPQGVRGCDFEAPLDAARTALLRMQDPDDPAAGFLPPTPALTVLMVTDEADCSLDPEWSTVFDPEGTRRFWSDPTAELPTSAVCWNTGVQCEGGPGVYDGCAAVNIDTAEHVGAPNENAVLHPIDEIVRDLDDVRGGSSSFELVSIAGVPLDYPQTEIVYADGLDDPEHALRYGTAPGCVAGEESAIPPPRLLAVEQRFHGSGAQLFSACADDYGPALAQVGRTIAESLAVGCYPGCAADLEPSRPGLDPRCNVMLSEVDGGTGFSVSAVPPCEGERPPPGASLCYLLRHDDALSEACVTMGANLEVSLRRDPDGPWSSPEATVSVVCQLDDEPELTCPELR